MAVLYLARYLLPVSSAPVEDGAILVDDGRIIAAGKRTEMTAVPSGTAVVDFGDAVVLPPLVNAHTHLELTHYGLWLSGLGETKEPESFTDWILQVIRVKRNLGADYYFKSIKEGIKQSLDAGTGAVGDILSIHHAREVYRKHPLKGRIFLETLGTDPELTAQSLSNIQSALSEKDAGSFQLGISPHSPYTLSPEYLREVFELCRRDNMPATMHLAESAEEVAFLKDSEGPFAETLYPFVGWEGRLPVPSGASPVAYTKQLGGLGPWNLLSHGVQVSDQDIRLLAENGATVVLCPRSNARLGVGKAPVEKYLNNGVSLALGTDSLASCETLSIWDEIAFAATWFEGKVPPATLLEMATLGGARALGLEGEMGALEIGCGANFQVLKPAKLPDLAQLEEFLCSPGRTDEVAFLFLDGQDVLQKN